MSIDRQALLHAIDRLHDAARQDFEKLNDADGALGDGDLGITLKRGMELVTDAADDLPDDLGKALLQCAQAFTRSSGSSYGTLMATGLMAMAKALKGETSVQASRVSELTTLARDAMQARGKAELGGKTVLDSLDAIAAATADKQTEQEVATAAFEAVDNALESFKDKQATIGRARMFGEKTIGMDDPGMLAMQTIVKALAGPG
ncbi:dihydroxyacetone kinase subunit L [Granulosicoccus sp.]|nr:dihydroxyacetone kinase subunit L [Granulosicoccus sp.]